MAERNTQRDGRNDSRPTGDACPECGETMGVGAWGGSGSITWQSCEDCNIGWGPFTGWVWDTTAEDPIETEGVADD